MNNSRSFRQFAAITAILPGLIAIASLLLLVAPLGFDFEAFSDFRTLLETGARGAALWRWAMILGILGYYLPIAPLVLALWHWLKPTDAVYLNTWPKHGTAPWHEAMDSALGEGH